MLEVLIVRKAVFLVLILSLAAGISFAKNPGAVYGSEGLDELTKQKGLFKITLINPDVEFSGYSKLCPKRVLLRFRSSDPPQDEATTGSMVRKRSRGAAIPEDEDLATFRQLITDAFVSELGSCELIELVEEGGPETLFVRATITDIVTDIATKSGKSGKTPKPYSVQGNIAFDLIDAETGLLLARVGENRKSRKAGDSVTPPDAGAEWVNIWSWAEKAAADLRQELERILSEGRG
jgi:hypothetical protein